MDVAATLPMKNQKCFEISMISYKPLMDIYNETKNKFSMLTKTSESDLTDSVSDISSPSTSKDSVDLVAVELEEPTNWTDQLFEELEEIYEECSEENWDGYGANKISHKAYYEATKLLDLIPTSYPVPEITPEPDGGIGLEWYKDKGQTFIISVDGRTVIAFAGLFGENNEVYGTETFTNIIPTSIFDHLKRLFSD